MKHLVSFTAFLFLLVSILSFSCKNLQEETTEMSGVSSVELQGHLDTLVASWYPITIDTIYGGFWPDFNYRWEKDGPQQKMLVTQARHLWTAATLASYYGDANYRKIADHGYQFLVNKMWDSINGGFHTLMGIADDTLQLWSNTKSTYGNSFAIYGLATYFKSSKDTIALNWARKTFHWLEKHAYDPLYKGYFDVLQQDGSWMLGVAKNDRGYDNFIRKDWKDQNSSIHLLEAFSALYQVWPDPLLKQRLEELLLLIRDTITTEKGTLTLHLERNWTPVSLKDSAETYRKDNYWLDHVSFGHDVETAFLMLEASHVLGRERDTITLLKAKKMVDHALENGWDADKGGFYDGGYYLDDSGSCTILNPAKVWWSQAEGLNALLLMAKLFPFEKHYRSLFEKQWQYIHTYMIDHQYGGWYHEGLDSDPEAKTAPKAHIWKVNYHNIRALINVIKMLEDNFELDKQNY